MIIDYKNKIVFLANTKVGSTSLEAALQTRPMMGFLGLYPPLKHTNFADYTDMKDGLKTTGFTTVCVVRHPVSKLKSWFKFRSRKSAAHEKFYTGDKSLKQFVRKLKKSDIVKCDDRCFAIDPRTGLQCDILFKYEEFHQLVTFCDALYDGLEIEVLNTSPERNTLDDKKTPKIDAWIETHLGDAIAWYDALNGANAVDALKLVKTTLDQSVETANQPVQATV